MGDQPNARPLPTQDNTTQKNEDLQPCLERNTNPQSQCWTVEDRTCLRPLGHWDRQNLSHESVRLATTSEPVFHSRIKTRPDLVRHRLKTTLRCWHECSWWERRNAGSVFMAPACSVARRTINNAPGSLLESSPRLCTTRDTNISLLFLAINIVKSMSRYTAEFPEHSRQFDCQFLVLL